MATVADRRWWLRCWASTDGKPLIYDGTCVGDRALSDALASMERRPDFARVRVEAEPRPVRQTYIAPIADPKAKAPAEPACSECELPESECRRRESTSGHRYTSPKGA